MKNGGGKGGQGVSGLRVGMTRDQRGALTKDGSIAALKSNRQGIDEESLNHHR